MARATGRYVTRTVSGESVSAFIPSPLPPNDPPLEIGADLASRLGEAERDIAQLDVASELVLSLEWFLYAFVRKEAVLSAQIEGTQASLIDLLELEAGASPAGRRAEVQEVSNYIDALTFARREIHRPKGLPLSARLFNETHRRLLRGAQGEGKQPGEVRRTQNWIGGTRPGNAVFVPPPAEEVPALLTALEKYIHSPNPLPPLIRAGLVHVQFETIHPYLDGNGRMGRLIITLLLEHWKLLASPLLYLSLYFKRHRAEYYRQLNGVRENGDWEGWLGFFLEGVSAIAKEALGSARDLFSIVGGHRRRLLESRDVSVAAIRLLEELPRHPVVTIPEIVRLLRTTKPTAAKAVGVLAREHILEEKTGRRRGRLFVYREYVDKLSQGTEI